MVVDEEDVRLEELRRGSRVAILPAFDPELYRSELCDHDAVPERSVCGICGYRKWLTQTEEEWGFRVPMTREVVQGYVAGNLNVRWHRDLTLVQDARRDEGLDRYAAMRANRERECAGELPQLPQWPDPPPAIPDEVRKKQRIVDIFCCATWEWGMFEDDQTKLLNQVVASLGGDYGMYNTYGWALCVGSLIPPPLDWRMPLPVWDKGARTTELVRAGLVPPREQRMDCLLALYYLYLSWVSRWSW